MVEKQFINLKIEKEQDLYNPFDPEKNLVSGSERRRDAKKDFVAQICLFGVGIILIALSIFLQDKVSPVHFAIISTLGTFSIWEGASIWIIRSPALRRR